MTRCYRPWSKFNAHQWPNLNERGHVWLSSADAGYITGTTQNINGGAYIA